MKQLFVMGLEPDGREVECKVLKILFESNEINIEYPDGNCEWYKLSDFELIEKKLSLDELRKQFEEPIKEQGLFSLERHVICNNPFSGLYVDKAIQKAWHIWEQCAKVNSILKEKL